MGRLQKGFTVQAKASSVYKTHIQLLWGKCALVFADLLRISQRMRMKELAQEMVSTGTLNCNPIESTLFI